MKQRDGHLTPAQEDQDGDYPGVEGLRSGGPQAVETIDNRGVVGVYPYVASCLEGKLLQCKVHSY